MLAIKMWGGNLHQGKVQLTPITISRRALCLLHMHPVCIWLHSYGCTMAKVPMLLCSSVFADRRLSSHHGNEKLRTCRQKSKCFRTLPLFLGTYTISNRWIQKLTA